MAIALGGRPDETAKMVCSRECIAYLSPTPWERNVISVRALFGGIGANLNGDAAIIAAPAHHIKITMYFKYLLKIPRQAGLSVCCTFAAAKTAA
jgi:hypothetical protein